MFRFATVRIWFVMSPRPTIEDLEAEKLLFADGAWPLTVLIQFKWKFQACR